MRIVIHTGTNDRSLDYASFMAATAIGLADMPKQVKLRFHTIPDEARGSEGHAQWLLEALEECDPLLDPDGRATCHIIADADTVFLKPGWDNELRQQFLHGNASCLGATYEKIGGLTSGDGPIQTYKDRPNLTWLALSPFVAWTDFDPRPSKSSHLPIDSLHRSATFGLPIGNFLLRDVGWQFPEYLHKKGMLRQARTLQHQKQAPRVVPKDIIDYSEEFWLGDVPFIAHQRGSGNREFCVDPTSKRFYDACSAHLMKLLGQVPTWSMEGD